MHLSAPMIAIVAGGALLGTAARYGLALHWPVRTAAWPWATFTVNLIGAFALGFLLEALARRGEDAGRRRLVRLGVGTGFLGAFTTYSSLAVETDMLVHAARPALAVAYSLASVAAGLIVALAGIALAAGHHRWRLSRLPQDPDAVDTSPAAGGKR
ncbi:fluoride efflux transporter FluC [Kineococcus sp. R86509]|uniref:fluoride efflux transporter FluC n=1 Tax=Kineococcus sp. R86509 TaxID=3093851 RepID=UPI0036D29611